MPPVQPVRNVIRMFDHTGAVVCTAEGDNVWGAMVALHELGIHAVAATWRGLPSAR